MTTYLLYQAAHLRALELFRADFLRRFPGGEVIAELEHMGATTSAAASPGGLVLPGKPAISRVFAAMSQDFRRWKAQRDHRKCDGLGLDRDASIGELLEVTTVDNRASAERQLRDKLDTLTRTVNRIHGLRTIWRATPFRPRGRQLVYRATATQWIDFTPTVTEAAIPGTVLYRIVERKRVPAPVPVPATKLAPVRGKTAGRWARDFAREQPALARSLAAVGAVALAIAAIVAVLDPVPGDEVAAAMAAAALVAFVRTGTIPPELDAL